jgi:hypothetical protein
MQWIKEYWVQLVFLVSILGTLIGFFLAMVRATKCTLRNDILEIWDRCKDDKKITRYQLESYISSRDLYFKLKGDGFVHQLDKKIQDFEIVD